MRISPDWLAEFVDTGLDPAKLAHALTMAGVAVESVREEAGTVLLEMDITTNRPDCLSHYGVAREAAAITRRPLRELAASSPPLSEAATRADSVIRVSIAAPEACARYCARVIENVTVGSTPAEIVRRLELMGVRSINNVADLTNYVLMEMGHPTHAFDADTLRGGEIRVRFARRGERLRTLDDIDRELGPEDLVIADAERPVALAGVMGGAETAISANTRRVVLESAWFDPITIRRTAKRHGMHTDASHRFERGADPEAALVAADRIAGRLQQWTGAQVLFGLLDVYPTPIRHGTARLRASELRRLLGADVPSETVTDILERLGFTVLDETAKAGDTVWTVMLASWRSDVKREVDLVEEVARIYGYDRFPARLPAFKGAAKPLPRHGIEQTLRDKLRGRGYAEAIALTFASREECEVFAPAAVPVRVLNPLSEEASVLRTSALPSMLGLLRNNISRGLEDVRLFEIGKTYERVQSAAASRPGSADSARVAGLREQHVLALGITGHAELPGWAASPREFDFFDLKADIENILHGFDCENIEFERVAEPPFHPGRSARVHVAGTPVARFGQLLPDAAWKSKHDVYVGEVLLDPLLRRGARRVEYQPPSRFPASERDFSFIFNQSVSWKQIADTVDALRLGDLRSFTPVEIFRGGNIPADSYSVLVRARFQRDDRTLRDSEIQDAAAKIISALTALGGQQRA